MENYNLSIYTVFPFIILLLCISILPISHSRFWHKNRNKAIISFLISLPVFIYFLVIDVGQIFHTSLEYFSFIILLFSLFTISGGIVLKGDIRATPYVNTMFLAGGAILANLIGTTGASMVLLRPLLQTNSERKYIWHLPIFFIFLVSNIGGCLTPVGDPPLFLGYLRGVPFLWALKLFPMWLLSVSLVLLVFLFFEIYYYKKETPESLKLDREKIEKLRIEGKFNILLVLGVILTVFFKISTPYRELIMITLAIVSYFITSKSIHNYNNFNFYPIKEVAILFAGIFITMVPALLLLHTKGKEIGITEPYQFFWLTGTLSSFLDNAPTYLAFFSLGQGVSEGICYGIKIAGVSENILKAISCGAVFMGANTYIGNGPNFMVKSIAEQFGVKMPSFLGYMKYSVLILIPIFIIITLIFFR